jgi:hypothetical protein
LGSSEAPDIYPFVSVENWHASDIFWGFFRLPRWFWVSATGLLDIRIELPSETFGNRQVLNLQVLGSHVLPKKIIFLQLKDVFLLFLNQTKHMFFAG